MELTNDERLVLMKALSKEATAQTKEFEQSLRDEMSELFERTGADRRTLYSTTGRKLGSISVQLGKTAISVNPGCEEQAADALNDMGLLEWAPKKGWEDHFVVDPNSLRVFDAETGEVVDWLVAYTKPATTRVTLSTEISKGGIPAAVEAIGTGRVSDLFGQLMGGEE